MVVAVVVGYPLMRLSGNYVAVATMGFLIIVYTVADPVGQRDVADREGLNPIPTYTNVWSAYVWAAVDDLCGLANPTTPVSAGR